METALRHSSKLAGGAAVLAVAAGVGALTRWGVDAAGVTWALVEALLVFIAWFDLATRRIPNVVTIPAVVLVVALRALFERGSLVESLLAGAASFAIFVLLALFVRGGMGMGDVKLAGLIGLLLGIGAAYALILGVILGGLVAFALLVSGRASRRSTFAYGPNLALAAGLWVLVAHPPPLV